MFCYLCFIIFLGCVYEGRVLRNGQAFSYDTCTMCRCENGDVTCDQIECGVLSCANQINPEGSCCPRCRDGCEYEGMSFNNGDFFTPMSNPCLQCSCRVSVYSVNKEIIQGQLKEGSMFHGKGFEYYLHCPNLGLLWDFVKMIEIELHNFFLFGEQCVFSLGMFSFIK